LCSGGLIVWSGPGSSFSFPTLAESGIPSALTTTAARVGRAACVGHRVGEKRHISTLGTHNIHAGKASRPGMALICTVVVTLALLNRPWNEEGCVAAGEAHAGERSLHASVGSLTSHHYLSSLIIYQPSWRTSHEGRTVAAAVKTAITA